MTDEDEPSLKGMHEDEVRPTVEPNYSDHLLKLQINQDLNSQAWIKFLIGVQGGLGVGYVYVLNNTSQRQWLGAFFAIAIACFGICSCWAMGRIIKRQHQWAAWFVKSYMLLPGRMGIVYPVDSDPLPAKINDVKPGYVSDIVTRFCWVMVTMWVIAGLVALRALV